MTFSKVTSHKIYNIAINWYWGTQICNTTFRIHATQNTRINKVQEFSRLYEVPFIVSLFSEVRWKTASERGSLRLKCYRLGHPIRAVVLLQDPARPFLFIIYFDNKAVYYNNAKTFSRTSDEMTTEGYRTMNLMKQ